MARAENAPVKKFNFTKRRIEDLPLPDRRQVYYSDSQTRGLEISIAAKGTKSYVFRRKIDGVSRRLFLGFYEDISIEQARGRASELNSRCGLGENVFETATTGKTELTLRELFDVYLARHARKSKKTWQVMEKDFERNAVALADKKLSRITSLVAEKLHEDITTACGPYAANRIVQLLRAVFNKGIQWKLHSGDNPFRGITLHDEKPRDRFLSEEEAGKLLKTLDNILDSDIKDFIVLSLFTGARKANLSAMHFDHIDWQRGFWTIPETKNGSRQVVALGGTELAILERRFDKLKLSLRDDATPGYVFPGTGKSGHLMDPKRSWHTLRKKAGLLDVTIHDLRRSLGSAMASANVNIALVKGALGHKELKTTLAHYAHTNKQAEREAKERVHTQWLEAARNDLNDGNLTVSSREQ